LTKLPRYTDWGLYRRLWRPVRPYWLNLVGLFLLGLLATPLALLQPLPLKIVVDALNGTEPLPPALQHLLPEAVTTSTMSLLVFAAILVVVVAVLAQLQSMLTSLLSTYTSEKIVLDCRAALFQHVQRLSFAYHDTKGVADTIYRIQNDAYAIQLLIMDGVLPLLGALFQLVVMVYIASRLDLKLVLLVLLVGPALLLLTNLFRSRFRRQWDQVKEQETSALSVIQEALASARVVKAFGQEQREHQRYLGKATACLKTHLRVVWTEGIYGCAVTFLTRIAMAYFFFIAARDVVRGVVTMGDLVLLMAYLGQVLTPLRTIGKTLTGMQGGLASAQRISFVLDQQPDVPEKPDARPLKRARGDLAFRNVSFAYGADRMALHDVSFDVPAGARVGIRGKTGAGKTTLVNLLTRFYDPTSGDIVLDGVELSDYKLADLRNQFAIVLQEPLLFSTTIAENIAYGRPSATQDEIIAAAKAARAHDFIVGLPQGYDTLVGERGMCISGGERQRIALARAFLKDAPILILDEPTSSVDVKTEAAIMEAMESLMRGRTAFLISHRPSTLACCSMVLELDHGKAVDLTATYQANGCAVHETSPAAAGEEPGRPYGNNWQTNPGEVP
jgi:ATP-binding cassette subfamily B protein